MDEEIVLKNAIAMFNAAKKAKTQVDGMILEALELYENEQPKLQKNKSNITLKEIAKKIEQTIPEVVNAFFASPKAIVVKTRISGTEDVRATRYLNREFLGIQSIVDILTDIEKTKMKEGTVWVTSGWETKKFRRTIAEGLFNSEEEIVDFSDEDPTYMDITEDGKIYAKWEKEVILKNNPTIKKIPNEDAYPDPEAKTLEDMRFFAVRKQREFGEIKKMMGLSDEEADIMLSSIEPETSLSAYKKSELQKYGRTLERNEIPKYRRNIDIIQLWTDVWNPDTQQMEPKIIEWIEANEKLIRIIDNPLETGTLPFYNSIYSKVPDSLWGEPLAFFLQDMQKVKTGAFRAILDNTTEANFPKEVIDTSAISAVEVLRYKKGARYILAKSPNAIQRLPTNPLPPMLLNLIQFADKELVELSGINDKIPALSKSQTDSTRMSEMMMLTQAKTELSLRFTGRMIGGIARDWLVLANDLLTEEQKRELLQNEYIEGIRPFDDSMLKSIEVKVATTHAQQNMVFQTNMLLQQSAVLKDQLPPGSIPALVANIFEVFGDEEMASTIRTYKPEMSEMEKQQMEMMMLEKQLELSKLRMQEMKMQNDIAVSRMNATLKARDSEIKEKLSTAMAERELATAQKLKTETAFTPAEKIAQLQKHLDELVPKDNKNEIIK